MQQYLEQCWNIHISLGRVGQILVQKCWHTRAKLKFQYNYFKKSFKKIIPNL